MKAQALALKSRLLGSGGTASGVLGGIGSIHNVCHSLCVTVVSILAIFGITTQILPLMFLQTYQMYFWWAALLFTGASYYFYRKQRTKVNRDRNLLILNFGLLLFGLPAEALLGLRSHFGEGGAKAGLPFSQLADYGDLFRFVGGSMAVTGVLLFFFGKRFQLVYRSISLRESVASSHMPSPPSLTFPKLNPQSLLFTIVILGFLINQYLMYRMGFFSSGPSPSGSTATSAMKSLSRMKLTAFDVVLAKERMDKNNDGICDACGMSIDQCIDSGQLDCNMGNDKNAVGILGSQHIHADFKVYIDGQAVDFSDKDHMGRMAKNLPVSSFIHVDSGSPAPEKTGDVLHMHATKVPLWLFFRSLGMILTRDGLTIEDGRILKNENGNTLKFYLNGKKVDDLADYVFQLHDKLLISYGPENDPDIDRQIKSITNLAKLH